MSQPADDSLVELSRKLQKLAKDVSVKEKQLDSAKKEYCDRVSRVNEYLGKLQNALGMIPENGTIPIDRVIEAQDQVIDPDLIVVSRKLLDCKKPASNSGSKRFYSPKLQKQDKKTRLKCSYCHEEGHKRAQCPLRLMKEA